MTPRKPPFASARRVSALLLGVFSAAWLLQLRGGAAEPWLLSTYKLCERSRLSGISNDASGITYSISTGTLFVITRNPRKIMEYSVAGEALNEYRWDRSLRDPEGITWMYAHTFAISEESVARISVVDLGPAIRSSGQDKPFQTLYTIELRRSIRVDNNKGLEGVTYDADNAQFFTIQEQDPKRFWSVSLDGSVGPSFSGQRLPIRDLSGLYYERAHGLFVLSQQTKRVINTDMAGNELQRVQVEGIQPEGLTFTPDGALMIVVGEPNQIFFYTSTGVCNDRWKPAPPRKEPDPVPCAELTDGSGCRGIAPSVAPAPNTSLPDLQYDGMRIELQRSGHPALLQLDLSVTADATLSRSAVQRLLSMLVNEMQAATGLLGNGTSINSDAPRTVAAGRRQEVTSQYVVRSLLLSMPEAQALASDLSRVISSGEFVHWLARFSGEGAITSVALLSEPLVIELEEEKDPDIAAGAGSAGISPSIVVIMAGAGGGILLVAVVTCLALWVRHRAIRKRAVVTNKSSGQAAGARNTRTPVESTASPRNGGLCATNSASSERYSAHERHLSSVELLTVHEVIMEEEDEFTEVDIDGISP
eukprot:jgi/Tetstr1/449486/TSEL_036577.t1